MSRSAFAAFALVTLTVACSSPRREETLDASAASAATAVAATPRALELVRGLPAFRDHAGVGFSLERTDDGFRVVGAKRFHVAGGAGFRATAPAHGHAPLRVEDAARSGVWIELTAEGARDVGAQTDGSAIVLEGALESTDIVHVVEPWSVEELRVLRDARAPSEARWTVRRGPGVLHVRVREGRVEVLDAEGVRLVTDPAFAVDARGERREVRLALEGDTLVARLDTEGLAYPIVIDPVWRPSVNNLPMSNNQMMVVRTSLGRVFAIAPSTPNFAELNVATETWASAGNAVVANRQDAMAVPLSNGKILLAGGGSALATAELFTPGAGSVATGSMIQGRANAAAVVLPSPERVLVIGGGSGTGGSTGVEVYDVAAGTWTARAALPQPRASVGAIRLTTGPYAGQVLVVGGNNSGTQYASALRYDPVSDAWVTLGTSLQNARHAAQVAMLPSGKVLIAGGDTYAYDPTDKVEIYDPTTDAITPGPSMAFARANFRLERLPDGKVLAIGGYSGSAARASTELFDETTNTWTAGPSLANPRYDFGSVTLPDGRVIVAGGAGATNRAEIFYPTPVPCTTSGPGCASCVDGVCCDSACTGQCQACDTAGREGYCFAVVGEAPHGTRPACTPTTICGTTGACATTCASDGACAPGFYCAGTSCSAKKPNGSACVGANECTSGQCVDGYCCNAACGEQCKACDVAGSLGTCTDVAGSPHGARLACASGFGCSAGACATTCATSAECASDRACDTGTGTCVTKRGLGALCASALDCASGFCVDGLCCDKACAESCFACDVSGMLGKCTAVPPGAPHGARTCSPVNLCAAAGACATACGGDADCAPGFYCAGSSCVIEKSLGNGCGGDRECQSGVCAAGRCCDKACHGECESCALAGSIGTCTPKPASAACGGSGCVGAHLVTTGTCDGASDTCNPGSVTACPGYLTCADATTCKTSCTSDADCTTNDCDTTTGTCRFGVAPDAGPDGASDAGTDGGVATDTGVTGDTGPVGDTGGTADTGLPVADAPAPKLGDTPTVAGDFQRCTKDAECSTGFCVEGVCCDSRCNERCHSCALLSNPGKCTLEPIGVDLKNECGPALSCLGTCGPGGECVGSGSGTMCARNRCVTASTGVGPAYCAAPGASCPTDDVVPFDCAPYTCEPAFGACRTSCVSTEDCVHGFVCDVAEKTCVAAPTAAEDEGGCSVHAAPGGPSGATWAAGLALVALVGRGARRRRARR